MYELTTPMKEYFWAGLGNYHALFKGGRCASWELKELIVEAIRSDEEAQHIPIWKGRSLSDKPDIEVHMPEGNVEIVHIKSGKVQPRKGVLKLSGHRLGRFDGGLPAITQYLNHSVPNLITVPHRIIENDEGSHHEYQICYIAAEFLHGLNAEAWIGNQQINADGVSFSLKQTMSWQIWWEVPLKHVDMGEWVRIT